MAKFRFKLDAVLRHRTMIEQQRQRALAALETERLRLESVIRMCQEALEHERAEMRGRLSAADLQGARWQAGASMRLIARAQRAAIELAGVFKRIAAAREELLAAARRRKAVELLKERRYEEWRVDQSRRELAAVDELAVMAAGRNEIDL
jgi:flagellar FliJ protein